MRPVILHVELPPRPLDLMIERDVDRMLPSLPAM